MWLTRLSRRMVTQSMKLVSVKEAIEWMEEAAMKEDIQRLRMASALGDWKMRPEWEDVEPLVRLDGSQSEFVHCKESVVKKGCVHG